MSDAAAQIPNIEAELSHLWEDKQDKNQTRGCLFNLIIYADEARRTAYLKEIIRTITDRFPCRILFIQGDKSTDKNYLKVHVSKIEIPKTSMACDQIMIEVSFQNLDKVSFLITPNLVPDLPVYLLWGQDLSSENEILPRLQNLASRLIFDSDCTENLQIFCHKILDRILNKNEDVIDMNWAYLAGWREVLVQTFDTKVKIDRLKHATNIEIKYNGKNSQLYVHQELEAIYLQGWLAAQLEFKFVSYTKIDRTHRLAYRNDGEEIFMTLVPDENPILPPSEIMSLDIATRDNYFYSLTRETHLQKVLVHVSSLEQCELPFTLTLPNVRRGMTFMREVFYKPKSEHYVNMLKMISQVNWQA